MQDVILMYAATEAFSKQFIQNFLNCHISINDQNGDSTVTQVQTSKEVITDILLLHLGTIGLMK